MPDATMKLPYAEDIGHYWKTSRSAPDEWFDRTKKLIKNMGGTIDMELAGRAMGKEAFLLRFTLKGHSYKIIWPVLPSHTLDYMSAKRQAATLLFYDVKAKCMTAAVLGTEVAFFSYMELPDGRVASELPAPELAAVFPLQLGPPRGQP